MQRSTWGRLERPISFNALSYRGGYRDMSGVAIMGPAWWRTWSEVFFNHENLLAYVRPRRFDKIKTGCCGTEALARCRGSHVTRSVHSDHSCGSRRQPPPSPVSTPGRAGSLTLSVN